VRDIRVTRQDVARGFEGLVVTPHVRDQFGAALNSGRATFLHGPSGSGKTFLAEHLQGLLRGHVAVPYAITVDDEIIQIFDPFVHQPVQTAPHTGNALDRKTPRDARWIECERPVAITGGELTLAMLDLEFDRSAGYYRAPPHLKANNGILIIDDLGRQLVSPRELMNRWIVPLDRHRDYLTFATGYKFMVPFDVVLIFSTNLKPADLADPAFMRRLGHKIHVGALTEGEYKAIFRQVCDEFEIEFVDSVFEHLLHNHHQRKQRPLLACYPRDLIGQVRDFACYENAKPQLTLQAIDRAWDNYFVASRPEETVEPASNPAA
jgi:energy-coupling factor transporter ATP-binding protein EcfA2